jgi:peptidoglycan/xylan/chitin deacetylase (PgdA/CDA1 family)
VPRVRRPRTPAQIAQIRRRIRRPPGHWTLLAFCLLTLLVLLGVQGVATHTTQSSGTRPAPSGKAFGATGSILTLDGERLASRRPPGPRRIALTFDDGPDPRWTPSIMQILHEEGVRATFCVVAAPGRRFPELVRAQHDAGHTHCDHTVDHPNLARRSRAEVLRQIGEGASFLESVDGVWPQLFRAPFGVVTPEVVRVAGTLRLRVLGWTVDSSDYLDSPPEVIVARTMAKVRPGAVVLLHDGGGDRSKTVAALRPLIQALKAEGYGFTTPTSQAAVV